MEARNSKRHSAGEAALHRLRACIIAGVSTLMLALAAPAFAQHYTVDRTASDSLTAYLRSHHLPLVGAQVMTSESGGERVMLYGFVATGFGKTDATAQTRTFLKQPDVTVENRIVIRPEIVKLRPHTHVSGGAPPAEEASTASANVQPTGGAQSFDQFFQDIERYGIKTPPDEQNSFGNFGGP